MESIWEATVTKNKMKELEKDISTDVLVIGGGMAGLLCSYFLTKAGVETILLEENRIASGVTAKTTAKLTVQHGLIYDKLIRSYGLKTAKLYLQANREAFNRFRMLTSDMDCQYEVKNSYVYSVKSDKKLLREAAAYEKLDIPYFFEQTPELPFETKAALCIPSQAQFHPLLFLNQISEGLTIYENTKVNVLTGTTAFTGKGVIRAKRVIVATHFPFLNKHGLYFLKLYQHRTYTLVLKNAWKLHGMYVAEDLNGFSLRTSGDYLLFSGASHRTGTKNCAFDELRSVCKKFFPEAEEVTHYATQDCMSLDHIPYVGRYSKNTNRIYVATGFNKWGMTSSMSAALLLTDLITGKDSPYRALFDPSRSLLHPQLFVNAFSSTLHLIKPTFPRCPHLGCALKWNRAERSYDCPCHGSRFSEKGERLDNPATGDLKRRS